MTGPKASDESGPVLVTGGAGFAGGHLLELLEADPVDLVAWFRPRGRMPPYGERDRPRWMPVDLLDLAAIRDALRDVRPLQIYHCAGAAHVGESWANVTSTLASNILATHNLLTTLAEEGVRSRVLIPGSAMVYRPRAEALDEEASIGPTTPYGVSKLAQERLGLRAWTEDGCETVLTRSFNHVGPRQHPSFAASGFAREIALIESGLAEPTLHVGNLDACRDLTDVRDTVRAYRLLMARARPGTIYNVCSGRAARIGDVLETLLTMARTRITVKIDPARYRPSDAPVVLGSHDRVSRETGWAPERPLDRTLADLLEYWRHEVQRVGSLFAFGRPGERSGDKPHDVYD